MKCLRMQTEQEMKEECLYLGFASLQPVLQISFLLVYKRCENESDIFLNPPPSPALAIANEVFQLYLPSALRIGTVLSMQKSPLVVGKTVIVLVFNFSLQQDFRIPLLYPLMLPS